MDFLCNSSTNSRKKLLFFTLVGVASITVFLVYRNRVPKIFSPKDFWRTGFTKPNGTEHLPRLRTKYIRILYWTKHYGSYKKLGSKITCGPHGELECRLTSERSLLKSSHAVIFHGWREDMLGEELEINGTRKLVPKNAPPFRYPDQYWILLMQEAPQHFYGGMLAYNNLFNWTWTYRTDSDVYMPYGRFERLNKTIPLPRSSMVLQPPKKKLVAWILSNCGNVPSGRLSLVEKLQEFIPVDIYGKCGNLTCKDNSRRGCKIEIGRKYRFYLALENSLCQDYVTEKTFNAFSGGMVPIVYGSANYDLFLPRGSFINMNSFPSAKSLAEYLLFLDRNPEEYVKYFQWKRTAKLVTDSMDYEAAYCRLCEKLHRDYPLGVRKTIPSMQKWLLGEWKKNYNVCNKPLIWT